MNDIRLKSILECDLKFHKKEIIKHRELEKQTKSKKQKAKRLRHFHQIGYIQDLLKKLGYGFCKECGRII